jgi:hypothetical protein
MPGTTLSVLERWRVSTAAVLLVMGVLIVVLPSAVFALVSVAKGMDSSTAVAVLVEQFSSERHDLGAVSLLGLLPWLLLTDIRWRFVRKERRPLYAFTGAIPILLVIAFVNDEFWSRYLPRREFLGFPHGIELVIGPLFFAPVGLAMGLAVSWAVMRTRP